MKVDVTAVNSFQKKISFEVPPDQVASRLDAAYKRVGTRARIAGFRPGKVPRRVLEARFAGQVEAEVANDLIQDSYRSALTDHSIQAVGQPELQEATPIKDQGGFKFTIQVDVRPSVELQKWTGVDVVYPKVEVAAEEIDRAVTARAEARSKLEEVKDRACEKGDFALVELIARDGETEVVHEPGTMVRTSGDPYFAGVEDLIVGAALEETKSGRVKFAETARTEAVAGRELDVQVKLLSLQSNVPAVVSDELATELGYEGGLQGMRSALEAQIRSARDEQARNQARANLLEALIAANPFDVPESMVEQSLRMLMDELRHQQALRTGRDPRTIGFNEAQVRDLRMRAAFAAKAGLILEWVSTKEGVAVEDGDLDRKYEEMATQRGQTVEAVRGWFKKEDAIGELKDRILEEKTLDWLLERANLVEPPAPPAAAAETTPAEAAPAETSG